MSGVGKRSRKQKSHGTYLSQKWPVRPLQENGSAEYWMQTSGAAQLHAAVIQTMLQMNATFPRNSQDKLQI